MIDFKGGYISSVVSDKASEKGVVYDVNPEISNTLSQFLVNINVCDKLNWEE